MNLKSKNFFLQLLISLALLELLLVSWARYSLVMNNSRIKYIQKENSKYV